MAAILEYKCPCCGGAIGFDTDAQKMKCPYCDTEFDVETLKDYDNELNNETTEDMSGWDTPTEEWQEGDEEGMRVYTCNSCGGSVIGDENTAATSCPYCGNPVVMMGQLRGELKPDYVIPFKLDKKAAKEGYLKHIKGKKLLPKLFKDQNHIDEIKGIYVPFWLFDADADASIRYKATRVRTWSDSKYDYTETSHFAAFRSGNLSFENVPADGASKIDDNLMESIEPFDFGDAVDFQTAYLAGYLADKYDVNADDSIERANSRIKKSTEDAFAETVKGYTTVEAVNSNIQLHNGKAKYAFYPVWILNTTYKDQKYAFAMNGQTGKTVGNLPCDKGLLAKWFGAVAAIASVAAFGISYLIYLL